MMSGFEKYNFSPLSTQVVFIEIVLCALLLQNASSILMRWLSCKLNFLVPKCFK